LVRCEDYHRFRILISKWPSADFPSSRHHLRYDHCLEDKRENYENCSVLLYTTVVHNDTQFSKLSVGLDLRLVIVSLLGFSILCVFWFSFEYIVLALFAFVVLGSFSSVLAYAKRLAEKKVSKMTYFMLSVT